MRDRPGLVAERVDLLARKIIVLRTEPSAVTSMPPSEISIAVAPGDAPTARFAVAIARRSIGPAAVTP